MAKVLKSKLTSFKSWLNYEKRDLKDGFLVYPKRRILFLFLGILLLWSSLVKLWAATHSEVIICWDSFLIDQIRHLATPLLDKFFFLVTDLGSGIFISAAFFVLSVYLFARRRRRAAITVLVTLVSSAVFLEVLKTFLGRPRPLGYCLPGILGKGCASFPSGHAGGSFYFYGMLFYLLARFGGLKRVFVSILGAGFLILILLIGLSRVYLGFHYLTDILAGFLLGGIFLLAGIILVDFFYHLK